MGRLFKRYCFLIPVFMAFPPSSLESIDPMQVLIFGSGQKCAFRCWIWQTQNLKRAKTSVILANAGHGPNYCFVFLAFDVGVGSWNSLAKMWLNKSRAKCLNGTEDSFAGYLGNVAAGRVANRLDLKGINFSIDAACASSLAALYVSIADLRSGASDVVLLGATDTHNQTRRLSQLQQNLCSFALRSLQKHLTPKLMV